MFILVFVRFNFSPQSQLILSDEITQDVNELDAEEELALKCTCLRIDLKIKGFTTFSDTVINYSAYYMTKHVNKSNTIKMYTCKTNEHDNARIGIANELETNTDANLDLTPSRAGRPSLRGVTSIY